jgi:SH3-like domain-containing protein
VKPLAHSAFAAFIAAFGLLCNAALAGEMRSVLTEAAILYDAPSVKAKKLYIVKKFTPLEVLVSLDGMSKVREAEGSVAWVEKNQLSETRTVAVIAAQADIRQTPDTNAPVLSTAEKWVALELLELPINGWIRVKHRDGITGFVRNTQVWGI